MIIAGILWQDMLPDRNLEDKLKEKFIDFPVCEHRFSKNKSLSLFTGTQFPSDDFNTLLETSHHILIGRAFYHHNNSSIRENDLNEDLLSQIWGNFIFLSLQGEKVEISRDPSGQFHFYYSSLPGDVLLFSSEISILYELIFPRPSYNWSYLTAFITQGTFISSQTPFQDIYELPPGCTLSVRSKEKETKTWWDPWSFYKPKTTPFPLVDHLCGSMSAWISPYQNINLDLSGGLDSSSLLFCLKKILKPHQTLKAVNIFHPEIRSSDESYYARKVCEANQIELVEFDASSTLPFSPANKLLLKPNTPTAALTHLLQEQSLFEKIKTTGSTLFISGHGGDHIFMAPPLINSLADYILEKGFGEFTKKMKELALYYRMPFYPLLARNIQPVLGYFFSCFQTSFQKKIIKPSWWHKDLYHQNNVYFYPDYSQSVHGVPGKKEHIEHFFSALATISLEVRAHGNTTYYPLLSQPIVELALAFPTYELYAKGYDRYPLRQAITNAFQTDLVWRRDKGNTTGVLQLGLQKNMNFILTLCLDGQFAAHKLIKKDQLEENIRALARGSREFLWPVINLISAELYLACWNRI